MTVTVRSGSESLEIGCHSERMTLGFSEIREDSGHWSEWSIVNQLDKRKAGVIGGVC
jgi:hypothetical protein